MTKFPSLKTLAVVSSAAFAAVALFAAVVLESWEMFIFGLLVPGPLLILKAYFSVDKNVFSAFLAFAMGLSYVLAYPVIVDTGYHAIEHMQHPWLICTREDGSRFINRCIVTG